MIWPNVSNWSAGKDNTPITIKGKTYTLWVEACGNLRLPTGKLVACDPFTSMEAKNNRHILVPNGQFPVSVTLIDVSPEQDRSKAREAYASITFAQGQEAYRKALPLARDGEERPEAKGDDFIGFGVDAGTACFVDDWSVENCMPDSSTWYDELFENSRSDCWFSQMDDPSHLREGLANIVLPCSQNGENLVLFHSGFGDGTYPVVGSFDANDQLLAVHIDFFVIPPPPEERPDDLKTEG